MEGKEQRQRLRQRFGWTEDVSQIKKLVTGKQEKKTQNKVACVQGKDCLLVSESQQ